MKTLLGADFETGGIKPGVHAILSIACICETGEEFCRYVLPEPGLLIDPKAAEKNGYTPEKWAELGAVPMRQAALDLANWLVWLRSRRGKVQPLAHGAGFDRGFMDWLQEWSGLDFGLDRRWECSQALLGFLMRAGVVSCESASLDGLCNITGITDRPKEHEALWDARACLKGYLVFVGLFHAFASILRTTTAPKALVLESGFDDPQVVKPGGQPVVCECDACGRETFFLGRHVGVARVTCNDCYAHEYKLGNVARI